MVSGAGKMTTSTAILGVPPIGTGGGVTIAGYPVRWRRLSGAPGIGGAAAARRAFSLELKAEGSVNYMRAVATNAGLGCSITVPCTTPWQALENGVDTVLAASLGPSCAGGPDSKYVLRLNLDREGPTPAQHFETGNLTPIDLDIGAPSMSA